MPPRARVVLHGEGISELLHDGGVQDYLISLANRVREAAVGSAPVESGAYRDSIHVVDDVTDRVVARVVADVPYALGVEAKTGNLSRALDSIVGGGPQLVRYKTKSGKSRLATQAQVANWTRGGA